MKIALLTQYYKPEMGAPQNRLYEMIHGLKECGNEVCIITCPITLWGRYLMIIEVRLHALIK